MNSSRFQRQQCYLCDLPRAPWAILNDFTEPICRGCCNYEGPDRLEAVIDYVRSLRKGYEHQVRALKAQSLNSTGNSIGSSPSPGGHSSGSVDNGAVTMSNSYGMGPHQGLIPPHHPDHMRFMYGVKHEPGGPNSEGVPEGYMNKPPFVVPGEPPSQSVVVPRSAEEAAAAAREEHRRMMAGMIGGKEPPRMPIIRRPPEFSEYPDVVKETLDVLNSCVPFDVRFKKDHNHVGRVFLFEAAPRTGATSPNEYELKIHIEYPRGSENFCQSASSVAKQMYQDSMKEFGRGLSSGFKYLEYELQGTPNDWRLLGDLLPEPVRFFKEPVGRSMLPQRLTENPTYHPMLGPPMFGPGAAKFRPKRKADEMDPGGPSRAPRRTYKEREDEQIQRHLWMQSQVDALRLSMAPLTGPPETSIHMSSIRASSASLDHQRPPMPLPHAPMTPGGPPPPTSAHQQSPSHQVSSRPLPWNGVPSSMAALISAATNPVDQHQNILQSAPSKEPRKSPSVDSNKAKSPDSSVNIKEDTAVKTEGDSHTDNSGSPSSTRKTLPPKGTSQLKCSICEDWLEDTHFVQCPSVSSHKFCFPCSKESIKKQAVGSDVFCPSGKRCPLIGSNLPWAFMQSEIQTILATKGHPKSAPVKEETPSTEEKP